MSQDKPWQQIEILEKELAAYSQNLAARPLAVVANKMDLPKSQVSVQIESYVHHNVFFFKKKENLEALKETVDLNVIPVSAKFGSNLTLLLDEMRKMYDSRVEAEENEDV